MTQLYPVSITSLSDDDLADMGFDIHMITLAQLEHLARKMADSYIENHFWIDLEIIADMMNLPRI